MPFAKTLCAVLLLSMSVLAAGPTLVLTDSGYQVMSVGADGKAVLQDVGQVVDLRGDAPPPGDPPPPDEEPPTNLSFKVTEKAKAVDDAVGAMIIGAGYKAIRDQIANGTVPPDAGKIDKVLGPTLDKALEMNPKGAEGWRPVRELVAQELATRIISSSGSLTKDQYVAFFDEVLTGLEASTAGAVIPPWLQPILDALMPVLIKLILDLLTRIGG